MLDADHPREACGVFGVWAPGEPVANLVFYGLYALQHRGQESAGMAVADGRNMLVYKEMGLVSQVFDEPALATLQGHLAIGHTRYSTTGGSCWENAQPTFKTNAAGGGIALAHNGNLTNTAELAAELDGQGAAVPPATTDTDVIAELLAREADLPLEEAIMRTMRRLQGAYSLVVMDERTVWGVRDPHGVRPLCVGRLPGGWVIASETAALDIVGASYVREVEPGEIVAVDELGLRSRRFAPATPHLCVFEHVYLARADSLLGGRSVHQVRRALGAALAREAPVEADLVIPVPDTAVSAAGGYAEASGIPYGEGLMKNRYVGRTFIQPSQSIRQLGIRLKLNPLREAIRGRRLVVVDDSIVRGNTTKAIVGMLREAGAREVHVRITSPPVRWPCFYGIDMSTRSELIASNLLTEKIGAYIGADSIGYLSLEAMTQAASPDARGLCTACFTGSYPIPLDARVQGKSVLESVGVPARSPTDGRAGDAPAVVEPVAAGRPGAAPVAAGRPAPSPVVAGRPGAEAVAAGSRGAEAVAAGRPGAEAGGAPVL
ncbi:MAG TPA: amidophosphoribosyltransferase [Actinomycetes bacterium]|jgi:amidophosphoribosyltransferase|nr:amidophosphoribosyltransferase [Actinomycetes bacterium]